MTLDALSASQSGADPLARWSEIIVAILHLDVSQRKKDNILAQANVVFKAIDGASITLMHGLDQSSLSTLEALSLPGLHQQAVRFAVLRIILVLSPIRDLLASMSREAYTFGPTPPFPQMQEFLEWLWDDRKYVLRKKKWP